MVDINDVKTSKPNTTTAISPLAKAKRKARAKLPLRVMKDLDLKPIGKLHFKEFAKQKEPRSNCEKCTVSVYYLQNELGLTAISESHIFTCFKHMKWKIPASLSNALSCTSSHYGWLNTKDTQNLTISAMGKNLVERYLPRQKKPIVK